MEDSQNENKCSCCPLLCISCSRLDAAHVLTGVSHMIDRQDDGQESIIENETPRQGVIGISQRAVSSALSLSLVVLSVPIFTGT